MAGNNRVGCLLLFLCFVPCIPEAQDDASTWIEDAHGCKFFDPNPEKGPPPQQMRWDGACVDGYLSGPGSADFGSIVFQGEFKRGLMESGEVRYGPSTTYKGALKGNVANGRGTWTYSSGLVLEGEGVNGVPSGVVDLSYPDGSHYRGEVKKVGPGDIQMHGRGRFVAADGKIYEGESQFDNPHGKGTLTFPGGGHYTGDFKFGHYWGKGVLEAADGSRYEGDFVDAKHQGQATLRYADGSVYVGQFVASSRQGKGRLQDVDGTVYDGDWKSNELNGGCTIKTAAGTSYSGECVDGKRSRGHFEDPANGVIYEGGYSSGRFHGQGRLQQPGYVYEGSFLAGARSGHGKEVYENGAQYEGEFSQDLHNGHGLLRLPSVDSSEVTYEGEFKRGVMDGNGKLQIGASTFTGEFTSGQFVRGRVLDSTGRIIEVDAEAGTFLQVLPNGSKIPLDPSELHIPGI
jgi:hypothetical protein